MCCADLRPLAWSCSSPPPEAAFTLLLYWELLHWEDRPLREFLHYPSQSEWQRKENLSRKVLHYFNKGKASQDQASYAEATAGYIWLQAILYVCIYGESNRPI